jgi:hypothetical protein
MATTPRLARPLFALLLAAAACSDSAGDGPAATDGDAVTAEATTQAPASTFDGAAPGTITVATTAITGQNGKMLLVFATTPTQQGQLGVACIPITSDSFEVPVTPLAEVPAGNPCAGGTPTVVFPEGSYTITAGIYTPGSQTAEATAEMTLDIVGDGVGSVQFTGAVLSAA